MKRKACMALMLLLVLTSTLFAAANVKNTTVLGATEASTQVGLQLNEEDLSIYNFGFIPFGSKFSPNPEYDPDPLDEIELTLSENKKFAENKNAGVVWYYFRAAQLPVLTIQAGKGLSRSDSEKIIAYDITIQDKTESSGDMVGLPLELMPLKSNFISYGQLPFSIKTTTDFTPDMASVNKWSDTITLKISSPV